MATLKSMNRRIFLKFGIITAAGMTISSRDICSENSCVPMHKRKLIRVIQEYGSEFGDLKFEKED